MRVPPASEEGALRLPCRQRHPYSSGGLPGSAFASGGAPSQAWRGGPMHVCARVRVRAVRAPQHHEELPLDPRAEAAFPSVRSISLMRLAGKHLAIPDAGLGLLAWGPLVHLRLLREGLMTSWGEHLVGSTVA